MWPDAGEGTLEEFNREWIHSPSWVVTCAECAELSAAPLIENGFSQDAAGRIGGTKKQDVVGPIHSDTSVPSKPEVSQSVASSGAAVLQHRAGSKICTALIVAPGP